MPQSYNGWPASPTASAINIDPDFTACGHKFPGGVKAGNVSTVLRWVIEQMDARVEAIDRDAVKDDWGYSYRPNKNNPSTLSCHASGTAIDYNATRHPNGHSGTYSPQQTQTIRAICAATGVVKWGGDFHGTKDEMHFEIDGTPAEVAAAAARLSQEDDFDMTDDDMKRLAQHIAEALVGPINNAANNLATSLASHIDKGTDAVVKSNKP